jgi:hypothetical protein
MTNTIFILIYFFSYCPEEDFQSAFVAVPPEIPNYPLPEVVVPILKQEVFVAPHEDYGVPHEEYGPPIVPHEEYFVPTTTVQPVTFPPPPPPTVKFYPYEPPTTTTVAPPPPPPPVVREFPYPAPTTTTTTTTTPPPPPPPPTTTVAPKIVAKYAGKVYSKYEHTVHHPAIFSPVVRFVEPKIVIHKKVLSFPLLKKKLLFKFGK